MKKVLIAEDNIMKYFAIKRALEWNGIQNILYVENQEAVWEEIEKAQRLGKNFDLIVSDVHYPLYRGQEANPEAGFILLQEIEKRGWNIPIILCSSQNYREPKALGCVWYHKSRSLELDFREILQKLEEER